jgi:glycosyltransferase involved in cell wall biosynthesis
MTILQLISSEGYYGAEAMLVTLADALSRLGCRCVVGVFADARFPGVETASRALQQGMTVEAVPCKGRWDTRTVRRIRKLLEQYDADVLHTHGYKADVFGCAAAWPRRTALVATCHNWPNPRLAMRAYAVFDRLILRRFDKVAAASEPVAATLERAGIPAAEVLPNGVDMTRFGRGTPTLRALMPNGCDRLVGFVGRMVPEKGGEILLHSAKRILKLRPQTAFLFVGEGPSRREWEALACRLGIAGNVVFTGVRGDMPDIYASLDLLALPSFTEATPMCVLEALAASRPVVATEVGSVLKIVTPGITGLLVEPGDVEGLASCILRLLADPGLAQALALQGRAHVARHFSADTTAAAYLDLYEQAVSHRHKHEQRLVRR